MNLIDLQALLQEEPGQEALILKVKIAQLEWRIVKRTGGDYRFSLDYLDAQTRQRKSLYQYDDTALWEIQAIIETQVREVLQTSRVDLGVVAGIAPLEFPGLPLAFFQQRQKPLRNLERLCSGEALKQRRQEREMLRKRGAGGGRSQRGFDVV